MADSKRQQLIDAIDARFKTIKTTNGYETELGNNVFAWRSSPIEAAELPCLLYRDTNETIELTIGAHIHTLTIETEIITSGGTAIKDIRKMLADIIKCIGADLTWGGIAEDTLPVAGEDIKIEQQENIITGAKLSFAAQYVTEPFNPYQ
ncbi:MAG TPA: hypothetical protein VI728_10365 [Syntrophales bacterium]|nr:MAG: hypothetical protein UX37_C0024G0005 [Microgenomates group bacterium GW2011_GWA2_46_16]HLE18673.1 hypothetical protein [Syntrophales bacterium]